MKCQSNRRTQKRQKREGRENRSEKNSLATFNYSGPCLLLNHLIEHYMEIIVKLVLSEYTITYYMLGKKKINM